MSRATVPAIIARIAGFFALAVAVIPLSIAFRLYSQASTFENDGQTVEARVVAVEPRENYDGRPITVAVLEFRDQAGNPHQFDAHQGDFVVDDPIEVTYLPDDPGSVRINTETPTFIGPLLLGALALIPALFGMFLIWIAPGLIRKAIAAEPIESIE